MCPLNLKFYDFVVVVDTTTSVNGAAGATSGNIAVPISDVSPYTV